jgi:hypothetical protein
MIGRIFATVGLVALLVLPACVGPVSRPEPAVVVGSGRVRSEARPVAGVDAVQFVGAGTLAISQGSAEGLTVEAATAILDDLGLLDREPEPVELVLTLDHDEVRELERVRMARDVGEPSTPVEALPSLEARFGGAKVGRNDPCPCGSGKKFKRCHGS